MTVLVKNLTFKAILGILDFERKKPQKIVINIKIRYNYNHKDFVDYAKVIKLIKLNIIKSKFHLIEDALNSSSALLKEKFPQIKKISIEIFKPDILHNSTVGVKIKKNFKKN